MREQDNPAPLPVRGAAYLIDVITPTAGFMLFAYGVALAFGYALGDSFGPGGASGPPVWLAPVFLAGVIVLVGYAVWWWVSLKDGQTPGKKIVGIRVVSASDGETLGLGMTLVRELLTKTIPFTVLLELTTVGDLLGFLFLPFGMFFSGILAAAPLAAAMLIDFLWPLWDKKSQTLHDKMVNTCVVRD